MLDLSPKTVRGIEEYARTWPGDVAVVAARSQSSEPAHMSFPKRNAGDLAFEVVVTDDVAGAVRAFAPRVVLAPLKLEAEALIGIAPLVPVSDYSLVVRWQNARTGGGTGFRGLPRVGLGLLRLERRLKAIVERADGLQCNGPHTFRAQGSWSARPHLFHDTRACDTDVEAAAAQGSTAEAGRIRLAFSGRWIPQKGVLDAIAVHQELRRRGVDARTTVFGSGPLDPQVRAMAGDGLEIAGLRDFEREWVPFVRGDVDVMVLPHLQGDSASTFLESMSCGVPVAGYSNVYWSAFHDVTGGGWVTPPRDRRAHAALLARLASDPAEIAETRERGLVWARDHTLEREFAGRVAHLRDVAQT